MARALLVGCGCLGRGAGTALLQRGWAVRGTSRSQPGLAQIDAAGIEPAEADPDRLGTIVELLGDVTVLAWLPAAGVSDAEVRNRLNGERLGSLLEKVVDSPVRGFVLAASPGAAVADPARALLADAERRWRIPFRVAERERGGEGASAGALADAVEAVIGAPG